MPSLFDGLAATILTWFVHSAVACSLALAASRCLQRPQDRDLLWKAALVVPILTVAGAMLVGVLGGHAPVVDLADLG